MILKNKLRFILLLFFFYEKNKVLKVNSGLIFVLHKETNLGFNHMHYITTWAKHMHKNRYS